MFKYHLTLYEHVEIFPKKSFGGCKSQVFVIGYRIAGRIDIVREPVRRSMRLGNDFIWIGVGQEALLRIRRLRRSACGAHVCFAPPPSSL